MEMKEFVVDCTRMTGRKKVHDYLKETLSLPDYYGRNLDALYDCLTEMQECVLILQNEAALNALGEYGDALLAVFRDAGTTNPKLHLVEEIEEN